MARSTGDTEKDLQLQDRLRSVQAKSQWVVERWDGSAWVEITDFDGEAGITVKEGGKKRNVANYSLTPIAGSTSFSVINQNGKWSEGSPEPEAGVLDIDTRIRVSQYYLGSKTYTSAIYEPLEDENNSPLKDENGKIIFQSKVQTSTQDRDLVFRSAYYIDDTNENVNGLSIDTINITARDGYKYAIEKDVTLFSLSGGRAVDVILKEVCDQVGIAYSSTSIDSGLGTITTSLNYEKEVKADDVFKDLMYFLNRDGVSYQMYLAWDDTENDNVLFVKPIPTLYEVEWGMSTNEVMSVGSIKKNQKQFLQRISVADESQVLSDKEQLGTANYTTTGSKTISWSGDATAKFIHININSGTYNITIDDVTPTQIDFTLSGTFDIDVTIDGNRYDSTSPNSEGEYFNSANIKNNDGQTARLISPLFYSSSICKSIAKGLTNKFGSPSRQISGIVYPFNNTFLQINDSVFPFIRNRFTNDIYYIIGLTHKWSLKDESTSIDLQDSGRDWEDVYTSGFIYDSDPALQYDIGFLYDMFLSPNAKEAEVQADYENNVIIDTEI